VAVIGDVRSMIAASAFNDKNTCWHNEFKRKYKIGLEPGRNEELKPTNNKGFYGWYQRCHRSKGDTILVSDVGLKSTNTCRYTKFNSTK
jgi:hypothetical protein